MIDRKSIAGMLGITVDQLRRTVETRQGLGDQTTEA